MLTQERADLISKLLSDDADRANKLLAVTPEEAVTQINALGNDFTVDELKEYGKLLNIAVNNDELGADELDSVAGGLAVKVTVNLGVVSSSTTLKW